MTMEEESTDQRNGQGSTFTVELPTHVAVQPLPHPHNPIDRAQADCISVRIRILPTASDPQ